MCRRWKEAQKELGPRMREGYFPLYRILWYAVPALALFLFFPFRIVQLFSLFVFFLLASGYAYSLLIFFTIRMVSPMPLVYGYREQPVVLYLDIINSLILPVFNLAVTVIPPTKVPGQQKTKELITLTGKDHKVLKVSFKINERGEYSVSPITIEGSDPFNLFSWKIILRDACTLIIYPSIHRLKWSPGKGIPGGPIRTSNKIYEDVSRIGSIRNYIPGDDIRRIHWKASAKAGELRTKEILAALDAPAIIMLDLELSAFPQRYRYEYVERAIDTAASLVYQYGLLKQRIGFVINGLDRGSVPVVPPQGNENSAMILLRVLARIQPDEGGVDPVTRFLAAGFSIQAGMQCILITPRSPEEFALQLSHPSITYTRPIYYQIGGRKLNEGVRGLVYRHVEDPAKDLAIEK